MLSSALRGVSFLSPCTPLILSTPLTLPVFLFTLPSVTEQCVLCVIHAKTVNVQKRKQSTVLHLWNSYMQSSQGSLHPGAEKAVPPLHLQLLCLRSNKCRFTMCNPVLLWIFHCQRYLTSNSRVLWADCLCKCPQLLLCLGRELQVLLALWHTVTL